MIELALKNWKYIVMAGLVAIIGFYKLSNMTLEKEVKTLTTDLAVTGSKLESTIAGVDLCNSRVDALVNSGELLSANITKAQVAAAKIRDESNKTIQVLISQKVPSDCKGALNWTYEQAQKSLKDWK